MQLAYNNDLGLGATAQYNGNISAMEWKNSEEATAHSYTFEYDNVNRLTKGDYFENSAVTTNFDLASVSYDANGNIEALSRFGDTGKHIDDLSYAYNNTNQLQSVSDIATSKAEGFADGVGKTLEYDYDSNGNLIFDDNKGIVDIRYNYLNLPARIWFGSGDSITYIYDAAGVKHAKLIDGSETGDQYYIGNMEYNQTQTLEFIHTNEGRVRYNGVDYAYDYYLKDHLGNTRVVFTEDINNPGTTSTEQVTNYYPFGMRFNQADVIANQTTDYLYNGKELQEDYGLNWLDYGARMYDPTLGRWHVVDPMAEKAYNLTPFRYAFNNPVRVTDPNGMFEFVTGAYGESIETSFVESTNAQITDFGGNPIYQLVFDTKGSVATSSSTNNGNATANSAENTVAQSSVEGYSKDEIIELGFRYYGGDYSGSFSDWSYYIADQLNQYNPIALICDGIISYLYGTDRFGNPQSANNTNLQLAATLFLGGMKVNARDFHRTIKPMILKSSGNFSKVVGRNPDIVIQKGKIILKGNGPYKGKTFETGLNFFDFFN